MISSAQMCSVSPSHVVPFYVKLVGMCKRNYDCVECQLGHESTVKWKIWMSLKRFFVGLSSPTQGYKEMNPVKD